MNTLCIDLLGLIDNYLNITHVILLNLNDQKIIELDPSKEIKVWLHMFDKGYIYKPLKILYKMGDIRTLQFIKHNCMCAGILNKYASILNMYLELLKIKSGTISIILPMDGVYTKEVIRYACKHNNLSIIKVFGDNGYYFETGPHALSLYKYAYKYRCTEIIDYINSNVNIPLHKAISIIGTDWEDLDEIKKIFLVCSKLNKWFIIGSCIKHKRYDVINHLLNYCHSDSVYNECRYFSSEINRDNVWIIVRLYSATLKYQDDEFSSLLIDLIDKYRPCCNILNYAIEDGANDLIIDKVLQKGSHHANGLQIHDRHDFNIQNGWNFNDLSDLDIKCTIESFIKIKKHRRSGFSPHDIHKLMTAFMASGRYDLLTMIMTI